MSVGHRMADRLQELLQQRALIKEHLEWIDAEIAAASGRPLESGSLSVPRRITPARPQSVPVAPIAIPAALGRSLSSGIGTDPADVLLAKLAAEEKQNPVPTKSGCWVFFATALILIGAAAWAVVYFFYR